MGPSVQSGSNRVRIHLMTAGCSQVTIRPLFQRPLVCWPADDAWPRSGDSPESLSSTSVGMQDLAGLPSRDVLAPCRVLTVDLSLVATRHSARPSADAAFGAADVQAAERHCSPSGLWQANPVAGIPPGGGEKSTRPPRASGADRQKPVCPALALQSLFPDRQLARRSRKFGPSGAGSCSSFVMRAPGRFSRRRALNEEGNADQRPPVRRKPHRDPRGWRAGGALRRAGEHRELRREHL